ncbi:MAG TPA: hypothetical protein VH878_03375, partial [Thermodesulfobacteriota bacterium]
PTPSVEQDDASDDLGLSPEQRRILERLKRDQRLEEQVGRIYDDLYDARKFKILAEYNDLDIRDLEMLAKSADPGVRENASNKLIELIEEMKHQAVHDLSNISPTHSESDDEAEFDDLIYQQQPDPEVIKRRMLFNCAKRIRREADRLSLSGPLSPAVRKQLEKSLIKAKADLEYAKRRTGIEDDIFDPDFDLTRAFRERPTEERPRMAQQFQSPEISGIDLDVKEDEKPKPEPTVTSDNQSEEAASINPQSPDFSSGASKSEINESSTDVSSNATRNYSSRPASIADTEKASDEVIEVEKRKPVRVSQELNREEEEVEVSPPTMFKVKLPERHFEGGARADAVSPPPSRITSDPSYSKSTLFTETPRNKTEQQSMEWDYFEIQSKKDLPTPSALLGKGPQPDNRFHSQERPYKGPEDAIRRWLDEGERVIAEVEKLQQPYHTRGGRQPKPRKVYSHQDEQIREKELRAQAKIEAQRKLEARAKKLSETGAPPVTSTAIKTGHSGKTSGQSFFEGLDEPISPIKKDKGAVEKSPLDELLEESSRNRDSMNRASEELRSKVTQARATVKQISEATASPALKSKSGKTDNTGKSDANLT